MKGYCKSIENFVVFLFCNSQKGVPELVLKDQKDITLEITVANNPSNPKNPTKDSDDALTKLIATFPDTLTYSAYENQRAFPVSILRDQLGGVRKHCVVSECFVIWPVFLLQEKQLSCVANQSGSQADCELGNPFKEIPV